MIGLSSQRTKAWGHQNCCRVVPGLVQTRDSLLALCLRTFNAKPPVRHYTRAHLGRAFFEADSLLSTSPFSSRACISHLPIFPNPGVVYLPTREPMFQSHSRIVSLASIPHPPVQLSLYCRRCYHACTSLHLMTPHDTKCNVPEYFFNILVMSVFSAPRVWHFYTLCRL
jgi:hypothetical protein